MSGSPGGSALGGGIPLQCRGLDYMIWPLFPALKHDLMFCRWVQSGYQTLEEGLGDLVPYSLIYRPPWVGACFSIF